MNDNEMNDRKQGVIPSQYLRAMIARGEIAAGQIQPDRIQPDQVQPASLDLRLGHRAWRVRASFLSGKDRTVADRLADFAMHEIDLDAGAVLETGCVYVVELAESLALPMDIAAAANAKSSTGRLDLLTRLSRLCRAAIRRDQSADLLGAGAARHAPEPDPVPPWRGRDQRYRTARAERP
jgi:hypothetical protein